MYIFGGASLLDTWNRNITNEQFSVGYIKKNRNKITINSTCRGMIHVGTVVIYMSVSLSTSRVSKIIPYSLS